KKRKVRRRKITVWNSGFSIRCSTDADDSFSGRRGGRAGAERRHRPVAALEGIARRGFRRGKWRERRWWPGHYPEDYHRFVAGGRLGHHHGRPHLGSKGDLLIYRYRAAFVAPDKLSAGRSRERDSRARDGEGKSGGDQRPNEDLHAADPGKPISRGGSGRRGNARADAGH